MSEAGGALSDGIFARAVEPRDWNCVPESSENPRMHASDPTDVRLLQRMATRDTPPWRSCSIGTAGCSSVSSCASSANAGKRRTSCRRRSSGCGREPRPTTRRWADRCRGSCAWRATARSIACAPGESAPPWARPRSTWPRSSGRTGHPDAEAAVLMAERRLDADRRAGRPRPVQRQLIGGLFRGIYSKRTRATLRTAAEDVTHPCGMIDMRQQLEHAV